jgi:tetratricopeptide (TPR) repeat protein
VPRQPSLNHARRVFHECERDFPFFFWSDHLLTRAYLSLFHVLSFYKSPGSLFPLAFDNRTLAWKMAESGFKQKLDRLAKSPGDMILWSEIASTMKESDRKAFIKCLQQNALLLKEFTSLLESDPKIVADFKISLQEMDSLEPFITNLANLEALMGSQAKGGLGPTSKPPSAVEPVKKGAKPGKSAALADIDSDLDEILGDDSGGKAGAEQVAIQQQLEEITEADKFSVQKKEKEYQDLIRSASSKIYSYSEQDIDEVITTYKKALSLKADSAIDWYNLAQAFLKRAQKTAGVFSYSFEGHYKDLSDFYESRNATKRAVKLDLEDKTYWEHLTMIYEIMGKKPLALYCAKKTLEMQISQEKRLSESGLGSSSDLQGAASAIVKQKVETLQKEAGSELDPFDEDAVAAWESKARKEKLQKGLPLDHLELYQEALETYNAGDMEATKNLLAKATKIKQDFLEAWVLLAEIKTQAAIETTDREIQHIEFSDVNRCLDKAIEINPDSIEPYKIYAKQYEFLDSRDNFIRVLDKIIELEPENWEYRKKVADVNLEKGLNFHIYGDAVQADKYLHKAIEMYPYDAKPWTWLGKNYILRGQLDEAIKALRESLRLEEQNLGATEGLIEAYLVLASQHEQTKHYDDALRDINEVFTLDPENEKAKAVQSLIIDDYCDIGFDALGEKKLTQARQQFQKALSIMPDTPFALAGIARVENGEGHIDTALESLDKALEGWTDRIVNYADEFVLQAATETFKEIVTTSTAAIPALAHTTKCLQAYLESFMNFVPFMHADRIHIGHVYQEMMQFFFDLASVASTRSNTNAQKVLDSFQASGLASHYAAIADWKGSRGAGDASIVQARILVLKDLKFFLDRLFNMFLFKSDSKKINNSIVFINFLRQDLSFTIKEIYDALEFLENGQGVIKVFDQLATYMHVASAKIRTAEANIVKVFKPIVSIQPHPSADVQAVITNEPKLVFMTKNLQPIESAIFTGKATRIKPSDAQWSPDGNKLLVSESKLEKRSFKALLQHGNQIMMLDLTNDPMLNPGANAFALDPEALEQQITTIELDQIAIAIGWKDDATFQALLKNGILMRWTLKEGALNQKSTKLQIGEDDLVALSPNQEVLAIFSGEKKTLTYINIRTDKVFRFALDTTAKPISVKWDNVSAMAHFLLKKGEGSYVIGLASSDGTIKMPLEFEEKDLNEDVFEVIAKGQHAFYLLRAGKKYIVTEASRSMWMEFPVEVDLAALLDRGILDVQWISLHEVRFFMEDSIIRLDLTQKMKQMLMDRITFLERFPRQTFAEKAVWLKDMRDLLA